jgi:hypothetical protein
MPLQTQLKGREKRPRETGSVGLLLRDNVLSCDLADSTKTCAKAGGEKREGAKRSTLINEPSWAERLRQQLWG